jgi:GH25 family lysozyme M1 (1,4-beta-N-acetylmuramidase)
VHRRAANRRDPARMLVHRARRRAWHESWNRARLDQPEELMSARFTSATRLALATALFACTTLSACLVGDTDSPEDEGPIDTTVQLTHPDQDVAGSQIRLVEGEAAPPTDALVVQTPGIDVSGYQGNVAWGAAAGRGVRFAYIKATEGTYYRNPSFASQYNGSYNAGIIRGAYHFATPNTSSGATQANYFVDHGGGWSADGKTLPPALDLEYNPYGSACYGKTHAQMVAWIRDFASTVKHRTGRDVVFYTSTSWWTLCTGNNASFGNNPLWIPRYGSSVGALPASWSYQTIWQYADHGTSPGDADRFNGDYSRVKAFAL